MKKRSAVACWRNKPIAKRKGGRSFDRIHERRRRRRERDTSRDQERGRVEVRERANASRGGRSPQESVAHQSREDFFAFGRVFFNERERGKHST